jgi:Rrf2 family protein
MDTILRISAQANMAMHALAQIAQQPAGTSFTVGQLADDLRVSQAHLSKVMQRLVHNGFLHSKRGPTGGFVLGRAPEAVSLHEIVEIFDGRLTDHNCVLGKKRCLHGGCALGALLDHVSFQVRTFLGSHTLSAMLAPEQQHARFLSSLGNGKSRRRAAARSPLSRRRSAPSR